jgi:hypothetical protein
VTGEVRLFHFSENPNIDLFQPHVPATKPTQSPAVWAIDDTHQSLYWFPRDCPRVAAWPRNDSERNAFREAFGTTACRVHAIEEAWLERMRATVVYRYELPFALFERWEEASGQWISRTAVAPLHVEPLGDLMALHADADIDLRVEPSLWPLVDLAVSDRWDFSIVRKANARPR